MINSSNGTEITSPQPQGELGNSSFSPKRKFSWQQTFAALKYRNYRLWFWGQLISLFGSWMQITAQAFFIYELTHSPAFLGYVGSAGGIPGWIFSLYGGVVADRVSRRKILFYTQTAMMILAFILAALAFANIIQPWHIILLAFGLGVATAFDSPARHAFASDLVRKEDLVNAIALNSTMFNTATAVGPAIAGITYAFFGPAWCFTINGISFLAVIFSLYQMNLETVKKEIGNKSAFKEIREGFGYLRTQKIIIAILSITTMLSIYGMGFVTLFPAWAVKYLHGDSTTNGFLQSARGIGAVLFALVIATINRYIIRGKYLLMSVWGFPILLFVFSFNRSLFVSLALLVLMGGFIITQFNLSNGLIQTIVSENFRGRVLSFYSFTFTALYPMGALWIGMLAEHFGSPTAILINSIILFIFAVTIWLKIPKLRSIS